MHLNLFPASDFLYLTSEFGQPPHDGRVEQVNRRKDIDMDIAVYPGNFDPITYGHLDIIERAAVVFDRVIVAVSIKPIKVPLFTMEERVEMITQETSGLPNVEVNCFRGLLIEFMKQKNARVIVRGLRAISDYENEFQVALMNRKLNPDVETVFLMAQPKYSYLSSSIVKEIASFKGDVGGCVSQRVAQCLQRRFALRDGL
jgi:pantetheine-phosphate adenylyltransferase